MNYIINLGIAEKLRMSQACDSKMDQNECVSNSVLSSVRETPRERTETHSRKVQEETDLDPRPDDESIDSWPRI